MKAAWLINPPQRPDLYGVQGCEPAVPQRQGLCETLGTAPRDSSLSHAEADPGVSLVLK